MTDKQAIAGQPRNAIPIAPQGWPFIIGTAITFLIALILCWYAFAAIAGLLFLFVLNFFRDPERVSPEGDVFICPADGKVIRAETFTDGTSRVDVFMNIFNIHVNRSPMSGTIKSIEYTEGRFINASFDNASEENERNRFTLEADNGALIYFTQVSGLVARRIITYCKEGDRVQAGQRIGMIRFGSRVDSIIPEGYTLNVKVGEHVVAGQTILAKSTADSQYESELQ